MSYKAELTGEVIFRGEPGYEKARKDFNLRFNIFPKVIVFCKKIRDVINAVKWSKENDAPLRARCGRHSFEAFSLVNDGIVIDVSKMNNITVENDIAIIEAGATHKIVYEELWKHGVTIPSGTCPSVGISGIAQGGGFGMLTRKLGMLIDSLAAVELVDANGKLIHADKNYNSDLFWALRGGGGGNFGIITAFIFNVTPISEVSIFNIVWDWNESGEVINAWQKWAPFTDERLTSIVRLFTPKTGKIISQGEFLGPKSELEKLLKPLTRVGNPKEVDILKVPYIVAVKTFGGIGKIARMWKNAPSRPSKFKHTGAYVYQRLSKQAIETMVEFMKKAPNDNASVEFQALSGAVKDISPEETAYFYRDALYNLHYKTQWFKNCEADENISWVEEFRNEMLKYTVGDYVNFPDSLINDWTTAYYATNICRLREVKTKYDPENVFNFPQSIPLL